MERVKVVTVAGAGPRKRASQLASVARVQSWSLGRYCTPAFAAALADTVAAQRPGVVHFDDAGVALAAPVRDAVNVYCSHNIEQTILRFEASAGSPVRRLFNLLEAHKVAREERRIWRTADLCLAVSPPDASAMERGGASRTEVCPNGVDAVKRLPLPPIGKDAPLRLLFVGSGNYLPYERGLAWLVREVLPRVRAKVPVVLDVVGVRPARPLAAEGVRYLGRVPMVQPYYEASHVVVVPVFEGSGTRLKIIEAAALGRPVVSTRLGAEGLPLKAGADYLQADSAADFAGAVLQLERWWREADRRRLEDLIDGAWNGVLPLRWPRVVERLAGLYRAEIAHRCGTEASPARGRVTSSPAGDWVGASG